MAWAYAGSIAVGVALFTIAWSPWQYALAKGTVLGGCFMLVLITFLQVLSVRRTRFRGPASFQRQNFESIRPSVAWWDQIKWLKTSLANPGCAPAFPSSFLVSRELDSILALLLRDFVSSWHDGISQSDRFTGDINYALRSALLRLKVKLESQDLAEMVVLRLVPIITTHIRDFVDAEQAVRGKSLTRNITDPEELEMAVVARYRDGHLHPAVHISHSSLDWVQLEHIRGLVARLLPELLQQNLLQSSVASKLLVELLSSTTIKPIIQAVTTPYFWNQVLSSFDQGMPDAKDRARRAQGPLNEKTAKAVQAPQRMQAGFPRLSPHDDERSFERFIRAIRSCSNLTQARRIRNEVAGQLGKSSASAFSDDVYVSRLMKSKQLIDLKISVLRNSETSRNTRHQHSTNGDHDFANSDRANTGRSLHDDFRSIRSILYHSQGLSCFMEFMDRQGGVALVQFWLVVDGMRNPLADDLIEEPRLADKATWTESELQDLQAVCQSYLSGPDLGIPHQRSAIDDFLAALPSPSSRQVLEAQAALFQAQLSTQQILEKEYLPGFRASDLFYKLLAAENEHLHHMVEKSARNVSISVDPSAPDYMLRRVASDIGRRGNEITASEGQNASSRWSEELSRDSPRQPLKPAFSAEANAEGANGTSSWSSDVSVTAIGRDKGNGKVQLAERSTAVRIRGATTPGLFIDEDVLSKGLPGQDAEGATSMFAGESDMHEKNGVTQVAPRRKPDLASLGLVNTSSRIGVFQDDDLFGDEKRFVEDEHADEHDDRKSLDQEDDVHIVEAGDLGLPEAISAISQDLAKLSDQESVIGALNRKAELTNNAVELRILGKSKISIERDIRSKELRRNCYLMEVNERNLFGRSKISIKSVRLERETDGQEYALYVIQVQREDGHGPSIVEWEVARRYSEFHDLHQRLRQLYTVVRRLEFPRRRLVLSLQRGFLDDRRLKLEAYLTELLQLSEVCASFPFRAFLSSHLIKAEDDQHLTRDRRDIVSRIYGSVAEGMEEYLGNTAVIDQLSQAGQNLVSMVLSNQIASHSGMSIGASGRSEPLLTEGREAQAELEAFDNQSIEPLVKPICDLFLELFELNKSQNWLRGRAVVIVLHQLLGGTIERRIRELAKLSISDTTVMKIMSTLKNSLWPDGKLARNRPLRTEAEEKEARKHASLVLAHLLPDLAGGVVGKANSQVAGRRLLAILNNKWLNAHLVFTLLDEILGAWFPGSFPQTR